MRKYEIMYIIRPSLDEKQVKSVIDSFNKVFANFKAKIINNKEIGLKDLAYEIEKNKKGYYYWFEVQAPQEAIAEFNRLVRINENVIRYIVCKENE